MSDLIFEGERLIEIISKIAELTKKVATYQEKIRTYEAMAESAHRTAMLNEYRSKLDTTRGLLTGLQKAKAAAEAARAVVTVEAAATTEAGSTSMTVARTGGTVVEAGGASTGGGIILRGVTAVGQLVGGGPATGTAIVLVVGGVAIWLLSNLAGKLAADKPVEPGSAMTQPRSAPDAPVTPRKDSSSGAAGAALSGDFQLVKSLPEEIFKRKDWEVNKDAGTVSYSYKGRTATYSWNAPKAIPAKGTTFKISGSATAVEGDVMNANIAASADNLMLKPDKPIVNRTAEGSKSVNESKEISVTPSASATEAKLSVYVGFTYRFDYLYERSR